MRSRSQGKICEDLPLQQLFHMQKQMCLASMSPHDCLTNLTRESWPGGRQGSASGGRFFLPLHAIASQAGQPLLVEVCSPRSQSGACAELQRLVFCKSSQKQNCSRLMLRCASGRSRAQPAMLLLRFPRPLLSESRCCPFDDCTVLPTILTLCEPYVVRNVLTGCFHSCAMGRMQCGSVGFEYA